MVQTRIDQLELRIVARRQLTDDETSFLRNVILENVGHPFPLDIVYVDAIPRTDRQIRGFSLRGAVKRLRPPMLHPRHAGACRHPRLAFVPQATP